VPRPIGENGAVTDFPPTHRDLLDAKVAKYGGVDLRVLDRPGEKRLAITLEPVNVYAVDVSWVTEETPPP